jgi:membrane protein
MKRFSFKLVWKSLKDAFTGFSEDKVTKLSASLAYYTVFSMGPLLLVIIFLCGLFLGHEASQGMIYAHLQGFIGKDAASQIETIIKNAAISGKGTVAAIIGIATLLIGATTVFGEIQDSINGIWGLKPKPKAGWVKLVKNRLLSFGMIGSLGFLLLVSLGVTAVVEAIGNRLERAFPDVTVVVFYIINLLLNVGVTTILFAGIFKVLPDAKIKWKDIWPGAIATSVLFLIGKFAISFYISKSNVGSTYGSAGSMVVLLLWVYYSAIILYYGAEFTKAYAVNRGAKVIPNAYAQWDKDAVVAGATPTPDKTLKPQERKHHGHFHFAHRGRETNTETETVTGTGRDSGPDREKVSGTKEKKDNHEKEEGAGVGSVLLGLALYYFNSTRQDPKR